MAVLTWLIALAAAVIAVATAKMHRPPWTLVLAYWMLVTVYWILKGVGL